MREPLPAILISAQEIQKRVVELGRRISEDYAGQEILCVGILRGSFVFLADLIRHIELPMEVEFVRCSSYGNAEVSSGVVTIEFADQPMEFRGRHVLIVDDIVDGGLTLSKVAQEIRSRGAASVKTCVLLDKPARRSIAFQADYYGFQIENRFVVGYGMDSVQKLRNLSYIGYLPQKTDEIKSL